MEDLANQPCNSGQFDDNAGTALPPSGELRELQQLLYAAAPNRPPTVTHMRAVPFPAAGTGTQQLHLSLILSKDARAALVQTAYRRHMVRRLAAVYFPAKRKHASPSLLVVTAACTNTRHRAAQGLFG
jgi:hypothetical protein